MASETTPPEDRPSVVWPDGGQIARQLSVLAVVVVVWGGLFWAAMRIPGTVGNDRSAAADARRDARRAAATAAADASSDSAATDTAVTVAGEPPVPAADPAPRTADATPAAPTSTADADPAPPEPTPAPPPTAAAPTPTPRRDLEPPPADVPLEELVLDPIEEAEAAADDLGQVSFAADIRPILERRCIKCHGGLRDDGTQRLEEGLSLLTVEDILAGSTWGSVVEPGDVAGSYLYELVDDGDMPDNEPRLLPRELRLIAAWIRQGASAN